MDLEKSGSMTSRRQDEILCGFDLTRFQVLSLRSPCEVWATLEMDVASIHCKRGEWARGEWKQREFALSVCIHSPSGLIPVLVGQLLDRRDSVVTLASRVIQQRPGSMMAFISGDCKKPCYFFAA